MNIKKSCACGACRVGEGRDFRHPIGQPVLQRWVVLVLVARYLDNGVFAGLVHGPRGLGPQWYAGQDPAQSACRNVRRTLVLNTKEHLYVC
jgi:hypothetical protein